VIKMHLPRLNEWELKLSKWNPDIHLGKVRKLIIGLEDLFSKANKLLSLFILICNLWNLGKEVLMAAVWKVKMTIQYKNIGNAVIFAC
jgi:hypothetical protein